MIAPATISPLLAKIRHHESEGAVKAQGVASAYDVVWGGIAAKDRPPRRLREMSVREVLAWQDSIDARYRSEAAGAYQILEDTLRGLVGSGACLETAKFSEATQDKLAVTLLEARGLRKFLAGEMSAETFGDAVAREWASFPVHTAQKGHTKRVERGESYYGGDGLNMALATSEEVLIILRSLQAAPAPSVEQRLAALEAKFAAMAAAIG